MTMTVIRRLIELLGALGVCATLMFCGAPTGPSDAGLSGRWNGSWGSDNVREVLLVTQNGGTVTGTSYFENRQSATLAAGHGVLMGRLTGRELQFALERDDVAFNWYGVVSDDSRTISGTFVGFSNDATYAKQ